ncbi:hypothetical protein BST95_06865 [Halioglobus japonicus]|uniref:PEP-CTERM sorting domain-containing protein n=1 Tax=Halioglobus japonicus TaxID=930805 RepID=A0AAP8SMY5_9GAMM|nr:hypothetical protein [Halioglobus japonicus]AQA18002.1 hypothetical protein BST95_06865 [Halioglobus japonicus]PLW85994.1 hypothetical protein C0029_05930 [Halioglobus japonicus]GHD15059.1 hypothetical protein GCM10007052_19460 [Halioglobus japonicus]
MKRVSLFVVFLSSTLQASAQEGLIWGAGTWGASAWGVGSATEAQAIPSLPEEGVIALIVIVAALPLLYRLVGKRKKR